MIKRMTVLFLALALIASVTYAQNRNVEIHTNQIVAPDYFPTDRNISFETANAVTPGTELIVTGYDYGWNNAIRRMIDLVDIDADGVLDPIVTAMKRDVEGGDRFVMYSYDAFGLQDLFNAFDPTLSVVGWGILQHIGDPMVPGTTFMLSHSGGTTWHSTIDETLLAPNTPFPQNTFGGNWPSFSYLNSSSTVIANTTDLTVYSSTDMGATWDSLFQIGDGDVNVDIGAATDTPAEVQIAHSIADDQTIAMVGMFEGAALAGNPDIIYWYGSADGGGTWNGLIIGRGSATNPEWGQIVNRPDYAMWPNNFDQLGFIVDDQGVTHVAINGYAEGLFMGGTDTVNVFPILYWNSRDQNWMSLSIEEVEGPVDASNNAISDLYPGNGIGQAYPTLSVSPDGQVLVCVWQSMEYVGGVPGTGDYNIYPGDGGANTAAKYYTDLHYTYSTDGGMNWEPVTILKGDASVMETFPVLAERLVITPGDDFTATGYYAYYEDPLPGVHLFASENGFDPNGRWLWDKVEINVVSAGNEVSTVNQFNLEQNYPNPFNPSTSIKYTLAERSNVSLKVFDVLGEEVATLVNTTQDAGTHTIDFDASELASGLYIYTLNAGDFTSSKKMMLLK